MSDALVVAAEDAGLLLRLGVALILSAAIGWDRELRARSAGLRTHILVALAATTFVVVARPLVAEVGPALGDQMTYDPTRIVHAVALAVGFLGAGAIFVHDESKRVRGLTTAASIWATAAIGVAVGLGRWVLATGATVLVVFVLIGLRILEARWMPDDTEDSS